MQSECISLQIEFSELVKAKMFYLTDCDDEASPLNCLSGPLV